ncbi:MAG TPA: response regulator transcription factor [Thermoanaerobaculia bacterium]|jgi:DNA-binding NarL/FixJ family response regulator|nr:response regulator transcription factor [Thermoanaerobaculia bacterium]
MIRVLLADDHTLLRAGLRGLLERLPDVEVVGEAGDGDEALMLAKSLRPDILLLDIGMPGKDGLEVAVRVMMLDFSVRILFLSMHQSEEYVLQALRAGAAGYLLKSSAVAELDVAVHAVARGEMYLSPALSNRVVEDYVQRSSGNSDPLAVLTPRQREILKLVVDGFTSKEIATQLGLSFRTVEAHRAQMMERLDVRDLTGLVRLAARVGPRSGER